MKPILLLVFTLTVAACRASAGNAAPPASAPSTSLGESAAQAPLVVRWEVQSDSGGRLRIAAIVVRRAPLHVPIEVHIEIPEGLQLVSGSTEFTLEPNLPPGQSETLLEFQYSRPPQGDLKVVALASGGGMGIHATDSFRFGRPEPQPPNPKPSGPDHQIGSVNLGPAVPLDQK